MFKARNDFAAFTKDIANATSELAQFNESSGEFEISGLQLDRLREIATITGIGADQLSEMAKAGAKFNRIKSLIPGTFNEEDQELISSLAEMKDGQYKVRIKGQDLMLNQINADQLRILKEQKKTLAERAEEAQTFDDAFTNLVNQFKSTLLPFVEELNGYFVPALRDFTKKLIDEGWIDKMKSIASDVGKFVVGVGKIVSSIVDTFGVGGTLLAAGLTTAFFNGAKWLAQGRLLAEGFNSLARVSGGPSGQYGVPGGQIGPPPPMTMTQKALGGNVLGGKFAAGTVGSMAAGAGLGVAGLGLNYAGDKLKESGNEGLGSLAKVAGSAAQGAGVGMFLGPWGAAIGAVLGGAYGAYNEYIAKGEQVSNSVNVDDAVVKFNPQDKIVSMSDGMVASTNKGKIDDLVGGGGAMKSQKIEFGKLEISGTIKLEMPGNLVSSIDLANEPEFVRKLSTLISQQTRINLSGGKLSPNPY
jgi:hypothetical protein